LRDKRRWTRGRGPDIGEFAKPLVELPDHLDRTPTWEGDTPYELVTVCLWSVLGVALVALVLEGRTVEEREPDQELPKPNGHVEHGPDGQTPAARAKPFPVCCRCMRRVAKTVSATVSFHAAIAPSSSKSFSRIAESV
jgi:hypothetical protein